MSNKAKYKNTFTLNEVEKMIYAVRYAKKAGIDETLEELHRIKSFIEGSQTEHHNQP